MLNGGYKGVIMDIVYRCMKGCFGIEILLMMLLVLDCEQWVYLVNEKTCLVMVEWIKGWIIGFVYRGEQ
jgi:hypothetical protein